MSDQGKRNKLNRKTWIDKLEDGTVFGCGDDWYVLSGGFALRIVGIPTSKEKPKLDKRRCHIFVPEKNNASD